MISTVNIVIDSLINMLLKLGVARARANQAPERFAST